MDRLSGERENHNRGSVKRGYIPNGTRPYVRKGRRDLIILGVLASSGQYLVQYF